MKAPSFRRLPLFVSGIPILREILDLKEETPISLQIEKPPRFIGLYLAQDGKDNRGTEKWPQGDIARHACAIERTPRRSSRLRFCGRKGRIFAVHIRRAVSGGLEHEVRLE